MAGIEILDFKLKYAQKQLRRDPQVHFKLHPPQKKMNGDQYRAQQKPQAGESEANLQRCRIPKRQLQTSLPTPPHILAHQL